MHALVGRPMLNVLGDVHFDAMTFDLGQWGQLESNWDLRAQREGFPGDDNVVVQLVFPITGNGNRFDLFQGAFGRGPNDRNLQAAQQVRPEGSCAFDDCLQIVLHKAQVGFDGLRQGSVHRKFEAIQIIAHRKQAIIARGSTRDRRQVISPETARMAVSALHGKPLEVSGDRLGVLIVDRRRRATTCALREKLAGAGRHTIFPSDGGEGLGMLVIVSSVIVLGQCRVAMVEVDDAMGDQVLLIMEMNFLGRDPIRPIGLSMATKTNGDLLDLDALGDL